MELLEVGKRLRELRLKTSLEQYEIAEALDKSPAIISHWENGKREMKFKDVYEYHQVLQPLLGDNWNYVCTGKKIGIDSDSAFISKVEVVEKLGAFLDDCREYRIVTFKSEVKELTTMFAAKFF
jgi:transcriptional regulator with XRE-family HTH domain